MAEIYHLLQRQIPSHIREKYPVFCTFVDYYYRWLQARGFSDLQNITNIDFVNRAITITDNVIPVELFNGHTIVGENGARALVVGISEDGKLLIRYQTLDSKFVRGERIHIKRDKNDTDKSATAIVEGVYTIPSVFIDEFSKLLDADHIFGTDTNNIAQILRHIKELYRSKGTEDALKYLLKVNQGVDAEVKYPFEQVMKPSDGRWTQLYAVTMKTHKEYYGKEPKEVKEARFMALTNKPYMDVGVSRVETFRNDEFLRFYLTEDPKPYEGQLVEVIENGKVTYVGNVVSGYISVRIHKGGRKWQVGQIFQIGGKDPWGVINKSYDDPKRPWFLRHIEVPTDNYGESGQETYLQHEEKPTICRVTVVDKDGAMVHAEIVQLGEYVKPGDGKQYTVSPLFFETGEDWEREYQAVVSFEFGPRHKEVGYWEDARGFISYQDIVLQDSYYYQQFSYDIVSTANPDEYQSLAELIHPVGTKMFTTYILQTDLNFDTTFDVDVTFPFVALSFFDIARVTEEIAKTVKKPLHDTLDNVHDHDLEFITLKRLFDSAIATDHTMKLWLSKAFKDHALTTDYASFGLIKGLSDHTLSTDDYHFNVQKGFNDFALSTDYGSFEYRIQDFGDLALSSDKVGKTLKKPFDDSLAPNDNVKVSLGLNKRDSVLSTDYATFGVVKVLRDQTEHRDPVKFKVTKPLTDKIGSIDSCKISTVKPIVDRTEGSTDKKVAFKVTKPLTDSTAHSESHAFTVHKPLETDTLSPTDSYRLNVGKKPNTDILRPTDGKNTDIKTGVTKNYDTDTDPYHQRVWRGFTNDSYAELGALHTITIK